MNTYVTIVTAFDNEKDAINLGKLLINKKLISSYKVSKVNSAHSWKGHIIELEEYMISMNSHKGLVDEIKENILELQTNTVPEILVYEIIDGNKDFLDRINDMTKD